MFILRVGLQTFGFDQTEYNLLKSKAAADFDPSAYAQASIVSGIKWMFILIPFVLLAVCMFFVTKNKINKKRFDAVLKGIECLKEGEGLSALSDDEVKDIETAVGKKVDELWQTDTAYAVK